MSWGFCRGHLPVALEENGVGGRFHWVVKAFEGLPVSAEAQGGRRAGPARELRGVLAPCLDGLGEFGRGRLSPIRGKKPWSALQVIGPGAPGQAPVHMQVYSKRIAMRSVYFSFMYVHICIALSCTLSKLSIS